MLQVDEDVYHSPPPSQPYLRSKIRPPPAGDKLRVLYTTGVNKNLMALCAIKQILESHVIQEPDLRQCNKCIYIVPRWRGKFSLLR